MGCLLAILGAFAPRVVLLILWIFTNLVDRAFTGFLIPLLGLLFLPFTTLVYVLVWGPVGLSGWDVVWIVLAVLLDLGSYGGGARAYGRRGSY